MELLSSVKPTEPVNEVVVLVVGEVGDEAEEPFDD